MIFRPGFFSRAVLWGIALLLALPVLVVIGAWLQWNEGSNELLRNMLETVLPRYAGTTVALSLGVGIGVDYALYILSITLARLRAGATLSQAYYQALLFTGKVVMLTGVTLAIGVVTWVFSPIKFQADMGLLLAFMFLWNMLGALVLLPALAHFMLRPATSGTPGTGPAMNPPQTA